MLRRLIDCVRKVKPGDQLSRMESFFNSTSCPYGTCKWTRHFHV